MQKVVPSIRISSYAISKAFYESLGFEVQWTHQFEPGFPMFAAIAREGMQVFLTEHTGDCAFGALVHFFVEDVDALYTELQNVNIAVSQSPNNGLGPNIRQMVVTDPDCNHLKFITLKN